MNHGRFFLSFKLFARCSWRYRNSAQALCGSLDSGGVCVDKGGFSAVCGVGAGARSVSVCKGVAGGWAVVWSGVGSRVLSKSNKPKGDIGKNLRFY